MTTTTGKTAGTGGNGPAGEGRAPGRAGLRGAGGARGSDVANGVGDGGVTGLPRPGVTVVDRDTGRTTPLCSGTGHRVAEPEPEPGTGGPREDPRTEVRGDGGDDEGARGDESGVEVGWTPEEAPVGPRRRVRLKGDRSPGGRRWVRRAVAAVAVLGVAGTLGFGHAWATERNTLGEEAAAATTARGFLLALTNFDAKNVDADFGNVQRLAAGSFATQAKQFFGSSIRQQLEAALASSRGQIRSLYVQSASPTGASVYGVVDQTYVNDKMSSPAADVLRVVVDLVPSPAGWRISAVTVLNGPSSGSTASASGGTSAAAPAGGAGAGG